jgi:ABC-type Zn uptake system ZnuABC Zn-binding protein ZnuA
MRAGRAAGAAIVALALLGCGRGAEAEPDPTTSAGVPPALVVGVVDFPSAWLAEQVGGDGAQIERITAAQVAASDADLFAYVPGLDPAVDSAVAQLPAERVVDLTEDVNRVASLRDPQVKDPYVWFDPLNVGTMAQTLGNAMAKASPTPFEASQFYGLRAFRVQNESLGVDQRLQEQFNPCRIPTLVVEAPVLTYLARAYAFDQVPLILWRPSKQPVSALYFTLDAEPAVREAAQASGLQAVPVDTFTGSAPQEDLLQGLLDTGDLIAEQQQCPLVTPSSSDRPG